MTRLSLRQLLLVAGAVLGIAACERVITIAGPPIPGPRTVDTVVVRRPETTFVQLPGRVDTLVTVRVDTLVVITHDTTVVVHTDTVTIVHTDTVRLSRVAASICVYIRSDNGDTVYLDRKTAINACAPQVVGQTIIDQEGRDPSRTLYVMLYDTLKMVLGPTSRAARSSLILPSWRATH